MIAALGILAEIETPYVIASGAKQSSSCAGLDCFVASLLAMTGNGDQASRQLRGACGAFWLRTEIVELAGLSVTALAERLHVTRQAASNLLNGHAGLSAEMAIRFEKAFSLKPDTLLRMQAAPELAQARAREDEDRDGAS